MNRTKIDAFIKLNIGPITLVGGLLGIIPLLSLLIPSGSSMIFQELHHLLSLVKPFVSFEFSPFDYSNDFYLIYRFGYLWMPILFYSTMLIGFFTLKNESSISYRLIRFAFSVIFIAHAVEILWILLSLIGGGVFYGLTIRLLIAILFKIVWAYIAFTILRSNKESVDDFGVIPAGEIVQLREVPQGSRFIHHLVDSFLYIGVCSGLVFYFGGFLMLDSGDEMGGSLMLLIVFIVARLLYYPILETLFGATPGKYLTGSKVVNEDGGKITFSQSLARTFSRMVPFEPFSFFGKRGWHDAWSKTKVVFGDEKNDFGSDEVVDDF